MATGQGAAPAVAAAPRRRNAAQTRQLLLQVASSRFARDGYVTTTVRDIADDAGVNVALISRYFASKEGLFEACLGAALTEIRQDSDETPPSGIAEAMARRITGSPDDRRRHEALLLLLRSSGDEHIDEMRRGILRSITERVAGVAGNDPAGNDDAAVLRAQIVLAAALGITLLRSSLVVQPLASATEQELVGPLSDLVDALLTPGPANPPGAC